MKPIYLLAFLIMTLSPAFAEDGLEYRGDIDGDGKQDLIQSGPNGLFGNAGGPFILILSKFNKQYSISGNGTWIIERNDKFIRFWSYWHMSADSGYLGYSEIDLTTGKMKESQNGQSLEIYPGGGRTTLGNKIYEAVFNSGNESIIARTVHNYTPPATDIDGKEWGK